MLRFKGKGSAPKLEKGGGDSGDLVVTVRVRGHPLFERKDADIEVGLPLTLS